MRLAAVRLHERQCGIAVNAAATAGIFDANRKRIDARLQILRRYAILPRCIPLLQRLANLRTVDKGPVGIVDRPQTQRDAFFGRPCR